MGCSHNTQWEHTTVNETSCSEECIIKNKERQLLYSAFNPLVGLTSLASMEAKLAGIHCEGLRRQFSTYFHSAELIRKLVLAFLLIAEMPHCQKVHLLLQLLDSGTMCVTALEDLVDSLTELASRVLPFASITIGKAYELHHYIASLTKARTAFRNECLRELNCKPVAVAELREKLVSSASLKTLVSATALRRKLWVMHSRLESQDWKSRQPQSSRNSRVVSNPFKAMSFDDSYGHTFPKAVSRLMCSEISSISSD